MNITVIQPPTINFEVTQGATSVNLVASQTPQQINFTVVAGFAPSSNEGGGSLSYIHTQNSGATTWVVQHLLNTYPNATAVDAQGNELFADKQYISANEIHFFHSSPQTGRVYVS
jgi:hypothetical protein